MNDKKSYDELTEAERTKFEKDMLNEIFTALVSKQMNERDEQAESIYITFEENFPVSLELAKALHKLYGQELPAIVDYGREHNWIEQAPYLTEVSLLDVGKAYVAFSKRKRKKLDKFTARDWDGLLQEIQKYRSATLFTPKRDKTHDYVPNSPGIKFLKDVLFQGELIQRTSGRGKIAKHENIMTGELVITYESGSAELRISTIDSNQIGIHQEENTRKILNFLLTKSNEQRESEFIYFNLSELVERGVYKSEDSAYKGVKKAVDRLLTMQIEGVQTTKPHKDKNKREEVSSEKTYIFTRRKITRNGASYVKVERDAIAFLSLYYGILPKWTYAIAHRGAYTLVDHIYYLASQQKKNIAKQGKVNIGFDNIRAILGLPTPQETHKHTEKIINPILDAIDNLEAEAQKQQEGERIFLTPVYKHDYKNATDFLTNGYLEINIDTTSREYLTSRQHVIDKKKKASKQIEAEGKKRGIAKATEKAIENEKAGDI